MLDSNKFIDSDVLFFGQDVFRDIIPQDNLKEILNLEFYHWLSAVYWGERLGIDYAQKMYELSTSKEDKEIWLETYRDELDHQKRIVDWMLKYNIEPTFPTLMMKKVMSLVEKYRKVKNYIDYVPVIRGGQLYLEESGACLMKWRISGIKNRSLQAIFYKIYKDEMKHISNGKQKLSEINEPYLSRRDNLSETMKQLFPIHVTKELLSPSINDEIKKVIKNESQRIADEILGISSYQPDSLLKQFEEVDGYECFACKPTRSEGLLLRPKLIKEFEVEDTIVFDNFFAGMNGLTHGGFISMALDEMMGYAITKSRMIFSLTTNLNIIFKSPVKCNEPYIIRGRIIEQNDKLIKCEGEIINKETEKVCARSSATFYLINKELCATHMPTILANQKTAQMVLDT